MEKIAVFVDDAEHAERLLKPLLSGSAASTRWFVVACAPRLTHRIGRFASHASREQWRERWARTVRERLEPVFAAAEARDCAWSLARGPLDRLSTQMRVREGSDLRLLDLRRPKLGAVAPALVPGAEVSAAGRWATPVAVTSSLSVVLALTD